MVRSACIKTAPQLLPTLHPTMTSSDAEEGTTSATSPTSNTKPFRSNNKKSQQRQQSPLPRKNSLEDPILQSIASKPSVLHSPQVTLTCYIPSSSVGAVIGRRGSTIANIQRQAQQYGIVRVSIVGHDDTSESVPYTFTALDWTLPEWTPVVIRGDACAALCAAQGLREVAGGVLDDVILDIPLNRTKFSTLIGKKGQVLANLSADTNVRIMVPQRSLRIDLIQLEGELDNVKVCFDKIVTLLSKKKLAGDEPTVSASIQVPTLPSQTKLRVVAKKTETSLQKKRQADETWLITAWGTDQEKVDNAIGMLETWKNNANNNNNNNNKGTAVATTTPNRRAAHKLVNRKARRGGQRGRGSRGGPTTTTPEAASASPPSAVSPEAPPKNDN